MSSLRSSRKVSSPSNPSSTNYTALPYVNIIRQWFQQQQQQPTYKPYQRLTPLKHIEPCNTRYQEQRALLLPSNCHTISTCLFISKGPFCFLTLKHKSQSISQYNLIIQIMHSPVYSKRTEDGSSQRKQNPFHLTVNANAQVQHVTTTVHGQPSPVDQCRH